MANILAALHVLIWPNEVDAPGIVFDTWEPRAKRKTSPSLTVRYCGEDQVRLLPNVETHPWFGPESVRKPQWPLHPRD